MFIKTNKEVCVCLYEREVLVIVHCLSSELAAGTAPHEARRGVMEAVNSD